MMRAGDEVQGLFEPQHAPFYVDACGFRPTAAGLIHLQTLTLD